MDVVVIDLDDPVVTCPSSINVNAGDIVGGSNGENVYDHPSSASNHDNALVYVFTLLFTLFSLFYPRVVFHNRIKSVYDRITYHDTCPPSCKNLHFELSLFCCVRK